ncbi:Uncharacterised protein [Klebsiella pneumoniae]|uniref:Uncharacterized protein n=1 Tax=Klebsiella pneumoniae TaxID=573 RepID=A0A377UTK5_KLEPN|nr:Uncharacterised protein [Klebsiella pneumoniae]
MNNSQLPPTSTAESASRKILRGVFSSFFTCGHWRLTLMSATMKKKDQITRWGQNFIGGNIVDKFEVRWRDTPDKVGGEGQNDPQPRLFRIHR